MASRSSRRQAANAAKIAELVQKYSGIGKTFRVKYVASEDITGRHDDMLTAACIRNLRDKRKQQKGHKPRVILGMNIKGVSLVEESSMVRTTVTITNVCYIRLDTEDMKYFGMIVKTKESHTGYRLYVFKAEKAAIAQEFVASACDLIVLVKKMLEEKKKKEKEPATKKQPSVDREKGYLGEEKVATTTGGAIATTDLPAEQVAAEEVPEKTMPASEQNGTGQGRISIMERRRKAQSELLKLETELNELFQDIVAGKESKGNFEDVLSKRATWAP